MEQLFTKKFTFMEFMTFIAPTVISLIFLSLYTIIDGIFVSQYVGTNALAAINITLPLFNFTFGLALMFATGSNAMVAKNLGEKKIELANQRFTFISVFTLLLGVIIALAAYGFMEPLMTLLGATPALMGYCLTYGTFLLIMTPFLFIRTLYEYFIRTDGNANFSLFVSVAGGVFNLIFDYVFIVKMNMGIAGAGLGTLLGIVLSMFIAVGYFIWKSNQLKFSLFHWDGKFLSHSAFNGCSEMVSELSTGFTTLLFNIAVLRYAGEDGVAALTIILYAHFVMVSAYLGFSAATAPIISYNFGAKNQAKLEETMNYSKRFLFGTSIIIFSVAQLSAPILVGIFSPPGTAVFDLAINGLHLFAWCFLFVGINIFSSGLFTSLSDGKTSAIIAFSRTLLFILLGIMIFPKYFHLPGIWLTVPFAEICTLFLSLYFLKKKQWL